MGTIIERHGFEGLADWSNVSPERRMNLDLRNMPADKFLRRLSGIEKRTKVFTLGELDGVVGMKG